MLRIYVYINFLFFFPPLAPVLHYNIHTMRFSNKYFRTANEELDMIEFNVSEMRKGYRSNIIERELSNSEHDEHLAKYVKLLLLLHEIRRAVTLTYMTGFTL
jgi:hypothetical protein